MSDRNENILNRLLLIAPFILCSCTPPAESTHLASLDCKPISIEIYGVKQPGKLMRMGRHYYRFAIKNKGKTTPLEAEFTYYRNYLAPSFQRKVVGKIPEKKNLKKVFNVYLGSAAQFHDKIEKCLVGKQDEFRQAIHAKSQPIQSFIDRKETTFVFWQAKKKDLELKFTAATGEYLSVNPRGNIYYHDTKNRNTFSLSHLKLKDGKMEPIHIDLLSQMNSKHAPKEIEPREKNPKKYLLQGKHIGEFFNTKIKTNPKIKKP